MGPKDRSDAAAAAQPPPPAGSPHRPTTQTLLAVGANTEDVAAAERAIVAAYGGAQPVTAQGGREVRAALLRLAHDKLEEGRGLCVGRLKACAVAAVRAYWQAVYALEDAAAQRRARTGIASSALDRPTLDEVMAALARRDEVHGRDDVRDALLVYGLSLDPTGAHRGGGGAAAPADGED